VLRGRKPLRERPGATLPPADFAAAREKLAGQLHREVDDREVAANLLYPRVFLDFAAHAARYGDTSVLPTPVFFDGMLPGEEISVEIEKGKTLIIKFLTTGDPHGDGQRVVFFELNGLPREVLVEDRSLAGEVHRRIKAEPGNPSQVGAPMPGLVVGVAVQQGEEVAAGQKLFSLEAMKMQTTLYAEHAGRVAEVLVKPGTQVEAGELLLRYDARG
jgi:pyruvate carboxylase